MSKELMKKETTSMTTTHDDSAIQGLTFSDVGISRIQLAQAMSEVTAEGKATPGDIYDGTTKQVLAKKGTTLDIVVLSGIKHSFTQKILTVPLNFNSLTGDSAKCRPTMDLLPRRSTVEGNAMP
jgi:hypothetical protein